MKNISIVFSVFMFLFSSCSTEDKIPEGLIEPEKMSFILKDLHLAEAYVNSNFQYNDSSKYLYKKLQDSILNVHGEQTEMFDSSMAYYQRNIEMLDKIYAITVDSLGIKEGIEGK